MPGSSVRRQANGRSVTVAIVIEEGDSGGDVAGTQGLDGVPGRPEGIGGALDMQAKRFFRHYADTAATRLVECLMVCERAHSHDKRQGV